MTNCFTLARVPSKSLGMNVTHVEIGNRKFISILDFYVKLAYEVCMNYWKEALS